MSDATQRCKHCGNTIHRLDRGWGFWATDGIKFPEICPSNPDHYKHHEPAEIASGCKEECVTLDGTEFHRGDCPNLSAEKPAAPPEGSVNYVATAEPIDPQAPICGVCGALTTRQKPLYKCLSCGSAYEQEPLDPPEGAEDCPMCEPGTCPGGAHRTALAEDGIRTREQYLALQMNKYLKRKEDEEAETRAQEGRSRAGLISEIASLRFGDRVLTPMANKYLKRINELEKSHAALIKVLEAYRANTNWIPMIGRRIAAQADVVLFDAKKLGGK